MEWERYYERTDVHSFGARAYGYKRALGTLGILWPEARTPQILDPQKQLTFVLGGFFPHNGTPQQFEAFCREIHPNPEDKHVFVDINSEPLDALPDDAYPNKMQAPLQNLHLPGIDFLFMDETVLFMQPTDVTRLAENMSRQLSEYGLILMASKAVLRKPFITDFRLRRRHSVQAQAYSPKRITRLTQDHLKTVLVGTTKVGIDAEQTNIVLLSRKDNNYPTHSGREYGYFSDYPGS